MNGMKKPSTNIAHDKKISTQTKQVKNDEKHHKNVIDQKQFEIQTLWINLMIFRLFDLVILHHA